MFNVKQTLIDTKEVIPTPETWGKGSYGLTRFEEPVPVNNTSVCKRCMLGALAYAVIKNLSDDEIFGANNPYHEIVVSDGLPMTPWQEHIKACMKVIRKANKLKPTNKKHGNSAWDAIVDFNDADETVHSDIHQALDKAIAKA